MKNLFSYGLCVAAGLLLTAGPASAQTLVCEFQAQANPLTDAVGSYNVRLFQTNPTTYQVVIRAATTGVVAGDPSPPLPNFDVNQFAFTFTGLTIPLEGAGSSGTTGAGIPVAPNLTPSVGGTYDVARPGMDTIQFSDVSGLNRLIRNNSNVFSATVVVDPGGTLTRFSAGLQGDDSSQFFGRCAIPPTNIVPEPGALALALPGLLPLGLVLLRRRSRVEASEHSDAS